MLVYIYSKDFSPASIVMLWPFIERPKNKVQVLIVGEVSLFRVISLRLCVDSDHFPQRRAELDVSSVAQAAARRKCGRGTAMVVPLLRCG